LDEASPYLILDARYERVREAAVIRTRAVLIAIGVNCDGHRQVLAVELAHRESQSSWKDFLLRLTARSRAGPRTPACRRLTTLLPTSPECDQRADGGHSYYTGFCRHARCGASASPDRAAERVLTLGLESG
jgi:Transposase, Mutator family